MGQFTFVSYTGADAGRVLVEMLLESGGEMVEIETETETRKIAIGFQPNPAEPDDDPEEPETDDEPSDSKLRP